jgi:hypothetical protein
MTLDMERDELLQADVTDARRSSGRHPLGAVASCAAQTIGGWVVLTGG